jgi:hypothetical protein
MLITCFGGFWFRSLLFIAQPKLGIVCLLFDLLLDILCLLVYVDFVINSCTAFVRFTHDEAIKLVTSHVWNNSRTYLISWTDMKCGRQKIDPRIATLLQGNTICTLLSCGRAGIRLRRQWFSKIPKGCYIDTRLCL